LDRLNRDLFKKLGLLQDSDSVLKRSFESDSLFIVISFDRLEELLENRLNDVLDEGVLFEFKVEFEQGGIDRNQLFLEFVNFKTDNVSQ